MPCRPQQARRISRSFKIFLTVWAFLENGLFSGLRAGWSALVYILKQEYIYANLCEVDQPDVLKVKTILHDEPSENTEYSSIGVQPSNPVLALRTRSSAVLNEVSLSNESTFSLALGYAPIGLLVNQSSYELGEGPGTGNLSVSNPVNATYVLTGCDEQDAVFNQCFTVATATMALSALVYGQLNYKFGIRAPRILSVLIFIAGALCFAFTDKDVPWLIFPGLLLVSSGGMALYITNNQVSYMFSVGSAAVVGLLCGALEASAFVQTIIKIAYENGISLRTSYLVLAGLYTLTLVSTFLLPKDYITNTKPAKSLNSDDFEIASDETRPQTSSSARKTSISNLEGYDSVQTDTAKLENEAVNSSVCDVHVQGSKRDFAGESRSLKDINATHANSYTSSPIDGTSRSFSRPASDLDEIEKIPRDITESAKSENPYKEIDHELSASNMHQHETPEVVIKNKSVPSGHLCLSVDSSIQADNINITDSSKSFDIHVKPSNVDGIPYSQNQSKDESRSRYNHEDQLYTREANTLMQRFQDSQSGTVPKGDGRNGRSHTNMEGRTSHDKTLWQCLLSRTFLLYLFWASVVQIILSMALGTFNPWLTYVTNSDNNEVSDFTDVLFYSMLGSPLLALCIGLAIDAMKRVKTRDRTLINIRTLYTAVISLGVTSLLSIIVCAFFMTCHHDVIIATSVALVIFRTGLYSCGTAFLRIMYPTEYFGILCGIMAVLAGGFGFLQYPLFMWVQKRGQAWTEAFGFLCVLGFLSLAQPAYLLWKSRQLKQLKQNSSPVY